MVEADYEVHKTGKLKMRMCHLSMKRTRTPPPQPLSKSAKLKSSPSPVFPSNRDTADWFNYNAIHVFEMRALPKIFDNNSKWKTAVVYMEYRIIDHFRRNTEENFTGTASHRSLTGDIHAIMRVHALLEQ